MASCDVGTLHLGDGNGTGGGGSGTPTCDVGVLSVGTDDDPPPPTNGDIDLDLIDVACGDLPDEVVEGDQIDITWDVVNNNDQPVTVTLEVRASGAVIDTESVSVGAGGVESGSTTVLFDQTGDFDIVLAIGGVS